MVLVASIFVAGYGTLEIILGDENASIHITKLIYSFLFALLGHVRDITDPDQAKWKEK